MQRNSGFIGEKKKTSANSSTADGSASGIHDIHDVHRKIVSSTWPKRKVFSSLTASPNLQIVEGNTITFTLTTEDIPNGSTLYYTISTTQGTTMVDNDFSISPDDGGVDGSFTTTNNSTTLAFRPIAEINPGDAESNKFKLQIRTESTSGPVVIESVEITVVDAISYGTDIRTNFYEISNRYITISTNDYSGNYDVGEVQQGYTGSARVYLVFKTNTSTTFYNDICVAAVQILNSSNVIQQTWNFSNSTTAIGYGWQTITSRVNGSSSLLSSYLTPQGAAAYTNYANIAIGTNKSRINLASATGSSNTGMTDGIANSTTTAYTVGDNTVAQQSGTYYIYNECSGAARYSHGVARSPSYNFSQGDKIRVVHAITIPSSMASTVNVNDALWIGIY